MMLAGDGAPAAGSRCAVVGIVNRTPDSFYDGGRMDLDDCVRLARRLVSEGAAVLDIGGVRAGAGLDVDAGEEIARTLPLVERLAEEPGVPISVETGRAEVARRTLDAGASIINDVTGLADPDLAPACADAGVEMIVMHNGGQIRGRPRSPRYRDVVAAVKDELGRLAHAAADAGVARDRIIVDPGLDFGKTTWHSLELVRRLDELVAEGWPVLVAPSHKDVVGETLGVALDQRLEGTLALVALSVVHGAAYVRVHDVRAAVRTVAMVEAVMGRRPPAAPVRGLWD